MSGCHVGAKVVDASGMEAVVEAAYDSEDEDIGTMLVLRYPDGERRYLEAAEVEPVR